MTALSLRNIPFHISGQYRAEVTDTAVCTPDTAVQLISLCCPVLFQARPIDSLNHTSYNKIFINSEHIKTERRVRAINAQSANVGLAG